ncbi:MAG: hypothetical protein RL490_1709, partial [Pseudomonadota bacterium]
MNSLPDLPTADQLQTVLATPVAVIAPFQAMTISRRAHALGAAGRSIIHMEYGQPSTGAPASALARARQVLDTDPMSYWESQALKVRIARHYHDGDGIIVDPECIV